MTKPDVRKTEEFVETALEVSHEQVETVCDFVIENICTGLVLEDEDDSDRTVIKFYVPVEEHVHYRQMITDYLDQHPVQSDQPQPVLREKRLKAIDWEEAYRQSIEPLVIANDVVVRPEWRNPPKDTKYDIILNPRMAFGTGTHETTRSCLRIIREKFQPGLRFLDMGCGSGILSILADKMGAGYIKAIDYDVISTDNSVENFKLNSVSAPNDICCGSIEQCDSDQPYEFVCANIIKITILDMLSRLVELTKPGGILVLSGLLDRDRQDIIEALKEHGQTKFDLLPDNEWVTFIVDRK